jgi:hypothetical protein
MVVYGLVGLVAGFVMRWSMWTFGLGQVFYPELYEEVGLWLVRLGTALSFVWIFGLPRGPLSRLRAHPARRLPRHPGLPTATP